MGHLFSNGKRYRGSRHARWMQAALAGWLALCGALAQAGVLSVASSQTGGVMTLTVSDTAPGDICSAGLCAADFSIDYDPAVLEFIDVTGVSDFSPLAFAPIAGQVLVSVFADIDDFPGSHVLFSVGFRALATQQLALTISPRDFGVPIPNGYLPLAVDITVDAVSTVPEPNTAWLAALALAGLAWRRRTYLAQDKRPVPSF